MRPETAGISRDQFSQPGEMSKKSSFARSDSRSGCPRKFSERVNPRNALADNQRMDVVRAFVGLYRLQIHHVAHDGIVVGHAVGAENVARKAGALAPLPPIVVLP